MWHFFLKTLYRNFLRQRAYTIINIAGLSIGLAVVMVIFSWINFHLNFESNFENSNNIYRVTQNLWNEDTYEHVAPTPGPLANVLEQNFPEIKHATKIHYGPDLILKTSEDSFVEQKVLFTDSNFLKIFKFTFVQGSNLTTSNNWIILTESIAHKYFDQQDPLGKNLIVSGNHVVSVIGILEDLPGNTHFDFEILLPLHIAVSQGAEIFPDKWYRFSEVQTYIQTLPETDVSELNSKIRFLKATYSDDKKDELILQSINSIHFEPEIKYNIGQTISKSTLTTFGLIASLVLVIACLNYIILSVGLSSIRIKSAGIRKIHGASKFQILIELIGESLIFIFVALLFGIILIEIFTPRINQFLNFDISVKSLYSSHFLSVFLMALVFLGILNGFYQALLLAQTNPLVVFKKHMIKPISGKRILKSLIVIQFTGGILLLIFSGIIQNQIRFMISKNPGFDSEKLLSVTLYDQSMDQLYNNVNQIIHEIKSLNGIENTTFSVSTPALIHTSAGEADWEGKQEGQHVNVQWNSVFFNYFETIGTPIIAGRDFITDNDNDITNDNRSVFILNETAIKAMGLSKEDAINRRFSLYDKTGPIIGIAKDFHFKPLSETIQPMAFFIHPYYLGEFLIRGKSILCPELVTEVKKVWRKYLPDDPFDYNYVKNTYQEIYNAETRLFKYNSFMAILIIVISSLGFSGLAFLIMEHKEKEIGIRKIHGASIRSIIQYLSGMFFKWIIIASCIAVPLGLYLSSEWMSKFAYRADISISIFIIPIIIIVCIASISIGYRVIQTSIKNPIDSIRYE